MQPILLCGASVWNTTVETNQNALQAVEISTLRIKMYKKNKKLPTRGDALKRKNAIKGKNQEGIKMFLQ